MPLTLVLISANRSFVRRPNGSYERVALGRWLRETYHFSDLDTSEEPASEGFPA